MEIWTLIVKSNTFNFIFLVLIIFAICKKVKAGEKLQNAVNKVKETIEKSSIEKQNSISKLEEANSSVQNVEDEVKEIFSKTDANIERYKEKIKKEKEELVEKVKENTLKLADLEEQNVFSSLSKKTALASIELAKQHIIKVLKEKPSYHDNFINKSINELDEVQYNEK